MSHAYHGDLKGTVLYDGCDECENRVRLPAMASLDNESLQTLVTINHHWQPVHISHAESVAYDNLRLYARIVFASGITEELAQ